MATIKTRLHRKNSSGRYDIIHYETEASLVTYTNNSQSTVSGALDNLYSGKANSSHNHAASNITSGTLGITRGGTGATTFTSGSYLIGNGTGAITSKNKTDVLSDIGGAPMYTYSTTDLTAGTSSLTTGVVYLVYE